jgi:UDP-N-acetylmuramyl pentapeptide phosphotransferase/UDP-N-acetylglucosamine-1-phosphate transferase
MSRQYVLSFAAAVIVSALIVEAVRRWAEHRRIFDHPNERSSHTVPKPRGGGLGIVVVTLAGLLLLAWRGLLPARATLAIAGCGVAVAAVSFLDDLYKMSRKVRFSVHLAAGAATALFVSSWGDFAIPGHGVVHLGAAGWLLVIAWIAGLTNAFNFMDGVDGIAGLQAAVAGAGWALLGAMVNAPGLTIIGLLLAGSSLGFLAQNWQPARIFMGDVGSGFLGYGFAALAVLASTLDPRLAVAGALLLWPFIFDAAFTVVRRALHGENILGAHKVHLYQRLHQAGLSHARVAMLYGGLAVLGVIAAAAVVRGFHALAALLAVLLAGALLVAFAQWMEARSAARTSVTGGA